MKEITNEFYDVYCPSCSTRRTFAHRIELLSCLTLYDCEKCSLPVTITYIKFKKYQKILEDSDDVGRN